MFSPSPLPRNLEASFRDLGSQRWETRVSAVKDVVRHARRSDATRARALPLLAHLLRDDPSSAVRSEAATALADINASEALPTLLLAVEDDDQHVRQMAIAALGEIRDARAGARLQRALVDSRPEVRYQAVIAFARVASDLSDIRDAVARAMSDTDPDIRYISLRVAEERLADAGVDYDSERHTCAACSEEARIAIASLGDPRLVTRARELTSAPNATVAVAAGLYLARLGHPDGLATVVDVVAGTRKTSELEDEAACVDCAGELGLRDAIPHLERRAWSPRTWVRAVLSFGSGDRSSFAWNARAALALLGHARARAENPGRVEFVE